MKSSNDSAFHRPLVVLGLSVLVSCGGGGGGGGGAARNFDSGAGFDGLVLSIAPALDGTGDVYVGGAFTKYNGVGAPRMARLNRDGSLDTGFNLGFGFDNLVSDVEPIADGTGDVYAAGDFFNLNGVGRMHIARVKPDGADASVTFGSGFNGVVEALALNQGLGDLYAGGWFTTFDGNARELVARVNPDGSVDSGFTTGTGFDDAAVNRVETVVVARDGTGSIYAAGDFSSFRGNPRNNIVRINPDGSNDGGFDPGSGFDGIVFSIAVANDGTNAVYAGGGFASFRGNSRNSIARVNPDGSNDGAFTVGTGFDQGVTVVAVANDGSGDIYVGGSFTSYDGAAAPKIARLNSDGSLDAGFAMGSGFDGIVWAIAPATDGSGDVLVGGDFTHYNGTAIGNIVRLNADGSLD